MIIGVMSDSHDNLDMIHRAIRCLAAEGAECVVHAGDFVAPFAVKAVLCFGGPVYGVFGNNDGEKAGIARVCQNIVEPPHTLTLGGRRVVVAHSADQAGEQALADAEIFIHGHTHRPLIEKHGTRLDINPGETGAWVSGRATVAVVDTESLTARIINVQ